METTAKQENPLDLLRLSLWTKFRVYLIGLMPWIILISIEWIALYIYTTKDLPQLHVPLFLFEILLFPIVLGYFSEMHAAHVFQSIVRRLPSEELCLTLLSGRDYLNWTLKKNLYISLQGAAVNFFVGLCPYFATVANSRHRSPIDAMDIVLVLLVISRVTVCIPFSRFSVCNGLRHHLKRTGLIVGILGSLFRVSLIWMGVILLTFHVVLIGLVISCELYGFGGSSLSIVIMSAALTIPFLLVVFPAVMYLTSRRTNSRAVNALDSWMEGGGSGK